jgi:hypothetical protein
MHVGVICPCLPSFRLLLRKLLPRIISTTTANYEMGDRTTTGTREMMGGGKDGGAPAKGIKKEQTIVSRTDRADRDSSEPPSEKVSQDDLSNPCDAWSMTELVGTKTEIKGGSQARG